MALARELGLPVIIHDRDAHDEVIAILSAAGETAGTMHCFSGDTGLAERALALGLHVGVAGTVTRPEAGVREVARAVPVERLLIETTELAPGLDTNLILYRGNGQVVTGNDDCAPGERRSCIEWVPDDTGLAYLLVGPVGPVPETTAAEARAYSLVIQAVPDETPTPVLSEAEGPTSAPAASGGRSSAAPTPVPEATPTPVVRVRPLSPSPPTPTLRPLQSLTVNLTIYYDGNDNRAPDASEGVVGVSVRLLDGVNNRLLGQVFTDAYGHVTLTIAAASDEVRVSVPYLGYNQAVRPPGKALAIRLVPLRLPSLIP